MIRIQNNEISDTFLPRTGRLSSGASVSGYDKLMESDPVLAAQEGWRDDTLAEYPYDPETQTRTGPHYDPGTDELYYTITDKPEPEPIPDPDPAIYGITLTADKTQITADGVDAVTVTATFEGHDVDSFDCYITVNGPPAEQAEIVDGEVVREFVSEEAGHFRVDVFAGQAQKTIFIEAVE